MAVLAETTKVAVSNNKSMESSPDLVPADETSFCDNNSTIEKGEISDIITPTKTTVDDTTANNNDNSSFWDLLLTLYLPFVMVWIRRSMFGSAHLIRTLIIGQLVRLAFFENISEWVTEKAPSWLQLLLHQTQAVVPRTMIGPLASSSSASKYHHATTGGDPHAWPPPAFTALALLTIFTLVIHPDGLTWVMLGKMRDTMYAALSVFAQCWEILMDDYGLFPTIAAATTLASLLFLAFVVLRTLSPKPKPPVIPHTEKKKKKKKGNSRKRDHHHQRHGASHSTDSTINVHAAPLPSVDAGQNVTAQVIPEEESPRRKSSADYRIDTMSPISEVKPSMDLSQSPPDSSPAGSALTTVESQDVVASAAGAATPSTTNRVPGKVERNRILSCSTVETIAMSDDQSCETASVRSNLSVSAHSARSGDKANNKKASTPRRVKRGGGRLNETPERPPSGNRRIKGDAAAASPHVSSRWDALKPAQSNGNNNGSNVKTPNQYQQTQQHHVHGKGRRSGSADEKKPRSNDAVPCKPSVGGAANQRPRTNKAGVRASIHPSNPSPSANRVTPAVVTPERPAVLKGVPPPPPPPGFHSDLIHNESYSPGPLDWEGLPLVGSTESGESMPRDQDVLTALLHSPVSRDERRDWNMDGANHGLFPPPTHSAMSAVNIGFGARTSPKVQENPFSVNLNTGFQADLDSQIEADLQELGGQMAGSILDF